MHTHVHHTRTSMCAMPHQMRFEHDRHSLRKAQQRQARALQRVRKPLAVLYLNADHNQG